MALVETLGGHPPGSTQQLRSGEVAVSIRRPPRGTLPLVETLSDGRGQPIAEPQRRDTAQAESAVAGSLKDATHFARVVPERVHGIIAGTVQAERVRAAWSVHAFMRHAWLDLTRAVECALFGGAQTRRKPAPKVLLNFRAAHCAGRRSIHQRRTET